VRILPVMDIMAGTVVRGIAGEREHYRPIVSCLSPSTSPIAVAQAFREKLNLSEIYIADLDAIGGESPAYEVYSALNDCGIRSWVDAGIRGDDSTTKGLADLVDTLVVGLETIAGPVALGQLLRRFGPNRLVFSLDLKNGVPLCHDSWRSDAAAGIAVEAIQLGVERVLILDLRRVGVNEGPGTEELCADLAREFPELQIAAGGGIRDRDDIARLRDAGVAVVLIASALHDGRITLRDLEGFT
jgi:phosphoribosylformimino-5-aminoimidazole carboxamide ribotide isomerase